MIHKLSDIHPEATMGNKVTIEAFSSIARDVVIGDGTWIGPNVTIMEGTRIGKRCRIFPGAVIGAIPQDLKFEGEKTTVEIGDNTTIREFVTLNRGTKAAGKTIVGSNTLLMAYVHIAHDCVVGNQCIMVNNASLAGEVHVGDWAILGGGTLVHQFVHIGKHAFLGGGSKARKDVPPYVKADRDPLMYMGLNSIGLRRRGFSNEKINEIQEMYRNIYLRGLIISKAIEKIEEDFPASEEKDEVLSFIKRSSRGIIRGPE
ncbi:MAG: acyl-ACP--UDP-N-acetylglucosamine O-acyltransferase [Chlorobi bacterium]|nr:acyl-ACP--UDP-N-acetylglucosamine O-acyltransferase [Chlorobiota bacterium]